MSLFTIIFGLCVSNTALADDPTQTTTATQTTTTPATTTATTTDTAATTSSQTATTTQTGTGTDTGTQTTTQTATATTNTDAVAPVNMEKKPATKAKKEKKPAPKADHAGGHGDGHVAGQFTIEAMWEASSTPVRVVLLTLLGMLIACVYVGIERLLALGAAIRKSSQLQAEIETLFLNTSFLEKVLPEKLTSLKTNTESTEPCYLKSIMNVGIHEFSERQDTYGIEAVERGLEKIMSVETKALGKGMNILATTGATAPFVGLVGTIFGIINAFSQIGSSGGGDLMTLAPAIGEALITTAFGIMVALAGVWIFNYFTGVTDKITNQMSIQSQSFIDWCYKQCAPPVSK